MGLGVIVLTFAALLGLVIGHRWAAVPSATAWLAYFYWNHIAAEQSVHGNITVANVLATALPAALTTGLVLAAGLAGVAAGHALNRLARRLLPNA